MSNDLPGNILIEPGALTITGRTVEEIIKALVIFSKAPQNDSATILASLQSADPDTLLADCDVVAMMSHLRRSKVNEAR